MLTQSEVLTALFPKWDNSIDPRTGKAHRIIHVSHWGFEEVVKKLPEYERDEVKAVLDELVETGRITAFNTHRVANVPSTRVYFYRDYYKWPPDWE